MLNLFREIFDGKSVVLSIRIYHTRLCGSGDLLICGVDFVGDLIDSLSSFVPRPSGGLFKFLLKRLEMSVLVKLALKVCDPRLLSVVAAMFIKHFYKNSDQSIQLLLGDYVCLLIDVEQNALAGNRDRLFDLTGQNFIAGLLTLLEELFDNVTAVDLATFQQQCQHLQQM